MTSRLRTQSRSDRALNERHERVLEVNIRDRAATSGPMVV
jgi:hypothetical protein